MLYPLHAWRGRYYYGFQNIIPLKKYVRIHTHILRINNQARTVHMSIWLVPMTFGHREGVQYLTGIGQKLRAQCLISTVERVKGKSRHLYRECK